MHMKAADFDKLMTTAMESGLVVGGPNPELGAGVFYYLPEE